MKKILVMGALLLISNGLLARSMHVFNFTDKPVVVKADVANANDTTAQVDANSKSSHFVFGCEGVNDVRKVEVRGELGFALALDGFQACYSKQVFVTPVIGQDPEDTKTFGKTTGIAVQVR